MRLGQQEALDVESISTGSLSLDMALGIGGLPKGRIIEIYGPESSGKNYTGSSSCSRSTKSWRHLCFSWMQNTQWTQHTQKN